MHAHQFSFHFCALHYIHMLTVMFVNIVNYYSDMSDWKGTNT